MIKIETVVDASNSLGECPLWDYRSGELLWIDSLGKTINSYDPLSKQVKQWHLSEIIGSMVLREKGGLVVALESGFHFFDLDSEELVLILDPDLGSEDCRLNDGKCDALGRYWCGTMNSKFAQPNASLYCLSPDLTCNKMATGFTVSNGISWSPDDKTMYFSDSRVSKYYRYDFDLNSGALGARRGFVDPAELPGRIDGATVDVDGNYWCALFDGFAIGCISPEGKVLKIIELPVRCPTMCNFGGENLDVLYVTTSTFLLKPEEINRQNSVDGNLLAITGLGVKGIKEPMFLG